ncbi:hypothetical protein L484_010639 [Morus notabilis]|uniref:Uncharacterized protein n=1 Tax=Morus notabilis TaxID=981085 RepID=W9RM67_9ROSA|nr:hypothetical protein L484_010639 [Morus notabilis]
MTCAHPYSDRGNENSKDQLVEAIPVAVWNALICQTCSFLNLKRKSEKKVKAAHVSNLLLLYSTGGAYGAAARTLFMGHGVRPQEKDAVVILSCNEAYDGNVVISETLSLWGIYSQSRVLIVWILRKQIDICCCSFSIHRALRTRDKIVHNKSRLVPRQ